MLSVILAASLAVLPPVLGVVVGAPLQLPECAKADGFVHPKDCWMRWPGTKDARELEMSNETEAHTPFVRGVTLELEDGVVVAMTIRTTGIGSQDETLKAMIAKFGRPTHVVRDRLQNRMGARYVGLRASWSRPGYVVRFDSTESDLDNGAIEINTAGYEASTQRPKPSL